MAEKEMIKMGGREAKRLHIIHQAVDERVTQVGAAGMISISYRQIRRMTGGFGKKAS